MEPHFETFPLRAASAQQVVGRLDTVPQYNHPTNTNHNAGWIGFNPTSGAAGPTSGYLYVATGDGGAGNDPPNNAQNLGSPLGKLLRIDVNNNNQPPATAPGKHSRSQSE